MPNPTVLTYAFPFNGIEIPFIFYNGTNEVNVKAALDGIGRWSLLTKDPVTKVLQFKNIFDNRLVSVSQNTWLWNLNPEVQLTDVDFFATYRLGRYATDYEFKIRELGLGSAKTPLLALGVGQQITITLDQTMGDSDWTMKVIPPAALVGTNYTITNVVKTTTGVTFVLTAPLAVSAGNLITVLAIR